MNSPKKSCSVETSRYYRSHMKSPRGRGGWIFEDESGATQKTFSGTYQEASRAAKQWGKEQGFDYVYVCP